MECNKSAVMTCYFAINFFLDFNRYCFHYCGVSLPKSRLTTACDLVELTILNENFIYRDNSIYVNLIIAEKKSRSDQ